jgi:hypothetical protein
MTDAERLSLANVKGWQDVESPHIEKWVAEHGRLPTATDKPPGGRSKTSAVQRKRLWAAFRERPVKYGTGRPTQSTIIKR